MELSSQNQHGPGYSNEDEQACAYLEANGMMGCNMEDFHQQHHQQVQVHPQYYEVMFTDQIHQHQHPWEIKEEVQAIPLTSDHAYGLCEGFFSEMQLWERAESYLWTRLDAYAQSLLVWRPIDFCFATLA